MSKRTRTDSAVTNPRNLWPTPFEAAAPLAHILPPFTTYVEPCAAAGQLIGHLGRFGHVCVDAFDIDPCGPGVRKQDAVDDIGVGLVITNPPYAWHMLQPMLDHWVGRRECWLLLPWDMTCNVRMSPYAVHIDRMLPLGRVSWMGNGKAGMDNSGWFHFHIEPQNMVLPRA